ncbi:hypothetical protein QF117_05345 [Vibrio sp. YMD68]|uniref:hypothetical protein n=1 Tax=Vibrio sp. YMD68 TaxID=3042300 RepID=UPI00249CD266|nr:hypothetical protein [Vibrio sp. YMD68]WGV98284.1 hypothetical protein QF117_05345 [Vibrio sp. YMD68]
MSFLKKLKIITLFIVISLISSISHAADPSIIFITESGSSSATIYANGNMQVRLNVLYRDVPSGYEVTQIVIKQAYTNNFLPQDWKVSQIYNGYDGNIETYRKYQSSATLRNDNQDVTTEQFYLSTNSSNADILLCVELNFSNVNGDEYTESTCNGDKNNGLVHVTTIPEMHYTFDDLDRETTEVFSQFSHPKLIIYEERFTLKNNRGIHDVNGCSLKQRPRNLIASYASEKDSNPGLLAHSALFLYEPNQGIADQNFQYKRENSRNWESIRWKKAKINTTESITFAWFNGYPSFGTEVITNPKDKIKYCRTVTFRDNYGNSGTINIKRVNPWKDGWGNIYYGFD